MTGIISFFWQYNTLIALMVFQIVMCLPYRQRKFAVLKWIAFVCLLIVVSAAMSHDWEWAGSMIKAQNILFNVPGRVIIMIIITLQIYVCYEISIWSGAFLMTVATIIEKIHFSLYKIIETLTIGSVVNKVPGIISILLELAVMILFAAVAVFIFNRKRGIRIEVYGKNKKVLIIFIIILVINDVFNLYQFANNPYMNFGMTLVVNRLFDITFQIMTIYMIYNLIVKNTLQFEQQKMEALMLQRKKQYEFSQQIIDSINIKSHDLKKQIRFLEKNEADRTELVKGLKDAVVGYDTIIETKSEALSTILSEKQIICYNKKIKFVCIVDADNMDFIKPIDMYTIMENLLDNAVEASLKVDEEYRSISVTVKQKANFLSIHTENYFSGKVKFNNGILLTMKKDPENHGYGVKSIQQIVEHYHGDVSLNNKGNIFSVNILIPIP